MINSFVWRPRAKMVAMVDMTLAVILIVIALVTAILAALAPVVAGLAQQLGESFQKALEDSSSRYDINLTKTEVTAVTLWIVWLGVAFTAALAALHIWAAFKLLKSTDKRKLPKEAKSGCRIWLWINIILCVVAFPVNIVLLKAYVTTGVGFVIRGLLILIVYQYHRELGTVTCSSQTVISSKVAPI